MPNPSGLNWGALARQTMRAALPPSVGASVEIVVNALQAREDAERSAGRSPEARRREAINARPEEMETVVARLARGGPVNRPEAPPSQPRPRSVLEQVGRAAVGLAAEKVGQQVGIGRGAVNTLGDVVQLGQFASRLLNPLPEMVTRSPEDWAAVQLARGAHQLGSDAGEYIGSRMEDPSLLREDLADAWQRFNGAQNPYATPAEEDLLAEAARRFRIGANQGELAEQVAENFIPGGVLVRGARTGGHMARLAGVSDNLTGVNLYKHLGFSDEAAAYLDELYEGMGHHVVPRRTGLPKWFMDSDFNVLAPKGITRGDFYALHRGVDDRFHGTRLANGMESSRANAWDCGGTDLLSDSGTAPPSR